MRIIPFAVVAVALVAGCKGSGLFGPDQSVILGVSKIEAPTTVASASPITAVFTVTTGGCVSFDHIEVNRDIASAHVIVWGHDAAKGKEVVCTQDIRLETHSYKFAPPFASTFTVQAERGRLPPLQATVQVQ